MSTSVAWALSSCRWQRLDLPHPVRPGDGCKIGSPYAPNFHGVLLGSRDPSEALEQLDVKPLGRKGQRHEYVDAFGAGWKARCDLGRRRQRQPSLPRDVK